MAWVEGKIDSAGLGFEPRYMAPEATVLPLDDPAIKTLIRLDQCFYITHRTKNLPIGRTLDAYYASKYRRIAMVLENVPMRTPTKRSTK